MPPLWANHQDCPMKVNHIYLLPLLKKPSNFVDI